MVVFFRSPVVHSLRLKNLGLLLLSIFVLNPRLFYSPLSWLLLLFMLIGNWHNDACDVKADAINRPGTNPFENKSLLKLARLGFLFLWPICVVLLLLITPIRHSVWLAAAGFGLYLYNTRLQFMPIIGNLWLSAVLAGFFYILMRHTSANSMAAYWGAFCVGAVHFSRELFKSLQDRAGDVQAKPLRYPPPPVWLYRFLSILSLCLLAAYSAGYFFLVLKEARHRFEGEGGVTIGVAYVLLIPFLLFSRNFKWVASLLKWSMLLGLIGLYWNFYF
jgi:hypothetical protein